MNILYWIRDNSRNFYQFIHSFRTRATRSCCLFCIILIFIGLLILIGFHVASLTYFKTVEEQGSKYFYEIQERKQVSGIISQTLKQMQKENQLPLKTQKFYKDSVYKQLKKIIISNYNLHYIRFISGKQNIGKSTSAIKIANQLKNEGYPVLYFSFKQSSITFNKKNSIKQFNKIIFQNNIWNMAKCWNSSAQSYQIETFNKQFKLKFGNKSSLIIVDQINFLFYLCAKKCPASVQIFFKQLTYISERKANVILISSDPNLQQYTTFSCFDNFNDVQWHQLSVNVDQDFSQMFKDLGFTKKTEEKFLQSCSQRGNILKLWEKSRTNQICCQIKKVNIAIQRKIKLLLKFLKKSINSQKQHREERYKCLKSICLQKSLTKMFVQDHLQYFNNKNILYLTEFKSKQIMRAFERYARLYKNQALVCKEN